MRGSKSCLARNVQILFCLSARGCFQEEMGLWNQYGNQRPHDIYWAKMHHVIPGEPEKVPIFENS